MKCKVCGYEFDSNREYCPMCGSKIPAETRRKEEEEMSWNTYDFPKPKKLEDIEMHWPSLNPRADGSVSAMKQDGTEGFVRTKAPEAPKAETPMPDPWAAVQQDFPKAAQPAPEAPSFTAPAAPVHTPQPEPAPAPQPAAPQVQPQPQQTFQTPSFNQGAWQMPPMQPEPTWTPYGVQTPPQPQVQIPPISPAYAPSSFTQQYGAQYSQAQYTQPQTAWTIPPQPQPGQQVYVTQPAQPVYIQPQPPVVPVYQAVSPTYTPQPAPAPAPVPAQPVQPAPAPAPAPVQTPQPEPAVEPEPVPAPAPQTAPASAEPPKEEPKPEPKEEPKERILEENIVATADKPAEELPKYEAPMETSIFAEMEPETDENGRIPERFFTFNKKNEEFQQLLNQEYERLRNLHGGEPEDLSRTSIYRKDTFQPTPAQDFFHNNDISTDLSEFEKMLMESTRDAEGDETLAINRDRIKGAALSAEELIDPLPTKAGDTHPIGEAPAVKPAEEPASEPEPVPQTPEEAAKSEHRKRMEAMAKAREAYFASLRTMTAEMKAVKDAEFKAQLEKEARIESPVTREKPAEKTPEQIAAEKAEEARLAAEREAAERAAAIERAKAEMKAAQEAQEKELGLDVLDQVVTRQSESAPEEPAETSEETPAEEPKEDTKEIPVKAAEPERDKTEVLGEILDDVEEETKKKEEREHSHWFLKFLLALVIVGAAAEGGTIALRHYAPDSPASIITTGIEQNVIQFVQSGFDQIKAKFQKDEPAETVPEAEQPGEEAASFVLSDLIAENNKNIEEVVENLAIGYDSQRSYDVPGLAASQLVTDTAEKTAVCKTLIGYNSAWIDFINGTSQDCLNYLKADGTAYRSAVTFDKIGQITEVFKKLEIGEIRKTEESYFVFAGETIEVTQDEATAQSSGYMVYELVPVGEELKIKDYYNITN